jgi:hypothetical protein
MLRLLRFLFVYRDLTQSEFIAGVKRLPEVIR